MVNTEHGPYRGVPGCTNSVFSGVLRQLLIDSAVRLLLFGYCTLVTGKQCFSGFRAVEIPPVS